jgi:glycosyltransferase involved in cell wall biosynthesis
MHSILPKQLGNFTYGNRPIFIKLFAVMEKLVLKTCAAVITIGADIEDYVVSQNPKIKQIRIENIALHAYQTSVKPEAVEMLKEQLDLDGRIPVVYTGTFEFYQGFEMVLECIPIVREQFDSVIFVFVGGKRNQANIWRRKAKEARVWDHTLFLDAVPPEESMVYLTYGKVLISPRLTGTSVPLKIYSYLHSGTPIVATNIDAHTQVLNPDIALLVEPTKEAFAEGIIKILRNPELGKCLGDNAHQFARENYNYQNYLAKVNQIYRTLGDSPDPELQPHVLEE